MADADDDPVLLGEYRTDGYRRVAHGTFLRNRPGLTAREEHLRDLKAWRARLPEGAVFTHVTAAGLLEWRVPPLPEQTPVFAATRGKTVPRRPGLICSRLDAASSPRRAHGLPVDSPEEILLRAARDLDVLDLVVMLDSAFELGDLTHAALDRILASRRPGVRRLRESYERYGSDPDATGGRGPRGESGGPAGDGPGADSTTAAASEDRPERAGGAESGSVLRSVLRVFLVEMGAAPRGTSIASAWTLAAPDRGGGAASPTCGLELEDFLSDELTLMRRLDTGLDRPPGIARVLRWRALVSESMLGEVGRERMMNRWHRQMGTVDLPGSA